MIHSHRSAVDFLDNFSAGVQSQPVPVNLKKTGRFTLAMVVSVLLGGVILLYFVHRAITKNMPERVDKDGLVLKGYTRVRWSEITSIHTASIGSVFGGSEETYVIETSDRVIHIAVRWVRNHEAAMAMINAHRPQPGALGFGASDRSDMLARLNAAIQGS